MSFPKSISKVASALTAVLLFLGISLLVPASRGQVISGNLVGTVVDASGAVVPNASLTGENVATGFKATAMANARGEFRFDNLPVGSYRVTATAPNFASATVQNVPVQLNRTNSLQVTLQLQAQSTTVEVIAAPPPINTTNAQIEGTFESDEIANLPITSGRGDGVLNLSLLEPGVASAQGVGIGSGPSVGGQRPYNNNFTVEGIDNNQKTTTGPLVYVPNDAVQEFSALQNQFGPEFGHSTGGQYNVIVMSGTNQYHGKLYEYFENRHLNAIDQTVIQSGLTSNPRFDFNRVGAQFGGPIRKNKLFFFANAEYNPLGQASTPAGGICAPTAAAYATIAGISGVSKTNLSVLQKYLPAAVTAGNCSSAPSTSPSGAANPGNDIFVGATPVPVGTLSFSAPNYVNQYYLVTSMDYDLSSKDQIRGRYIYNRYSAPDIDASLPAFYQPLPERFHLVALSEYHTFNPSLTNEFRVGFNRFSQIISAGNFQFPGLDAFPNLDFAVLNLQLGPDSAAPQYTVQNFYQVSENLTWVHGSHTFKFGIEGLKFISPENFTQRQRGDYEYNTVGLYLLDITPDSLAERANGNSTYYGDQAGIYWYAADVWRLKPNLSLDLGIRYEYVTIPVGERRQKLNIAASVPGLIDFSEPQAPTRDYAPRIGVVWSPGSSGATSIRAGFGMGYDILYDNIGLTAVPPQVGSTIDALTPVISGFLAKGGIPPGTGSGLKTFPTIAAQRAATSDLLPVHQLVPAAVDWNLSVQHTFGKSYTFEARYLGTHGYHLDVQDQINKRAVVTPTQFLPTYIGSTPSQAALDALPLTLTALRSQSQFVPAFANAGFGTGNITEFQPIGSSMYHGMALQITRRLEHGLTLNGAWTWSHTLDNSTADFFTTRLSPRRPQDFQNLNADWANSILDHRHRITLTAMYDLPYFKSGSWVRKNLMGNWLIAPIYTYQSGGFFTVQSSIDSNLNGDTAGDRTIINPAGNSFTGSGVTALTNSSGQIVAYKADDPTARYIQAGLGALATSGRNTEQERPINNVDLTVAKNFNITERFRTEFQGQFGNFFNHPQFIPGFVNRIDDGITTQQAIYQSGAVASYVNPTESSFDRANKIFGSNSRIVTLVLKLDF